MPRWSYLVLCHLGGELTKEDKSTNVQRTRYGKENQEKSKKIDERRASLALQSRVGLAVVVFFLFFIKCLFSSIF
jgi:hypothetical protein